MVPRKHRSVAAIEEQEQGIVENSTIPSVSFTRRALFRYGGLSLVIGVPVVILVLFILYPLLAVILQSVFPNIYASNPNIAPSLSAIGQVFSDTLSYQALGNSLWLSGVTAFISAVVGTLLAILAKRTDLPLRRAMDILVWIIFFTPSFLIGE